MTSFGVRGRVDRDGFMPTFRIQGQVYHRIGSLLPLPGAQPQFLQIYFMGGEELQLDLRCSLFEQNTRRNIVSELQKLFDLNNNLIRSFKTALDMLPSDEHRVVIRADRAPIGEHRGRFNAPSVDDIAVVMVQGECSRRDIVLQRRGGYLQRIDELHHLYDALQYPVILWQGSSTYHINLKQVNPLTGAQSDKNVSAMDYYSYQFMIRGERPSILHRCGALTNQYCTDLGAKIESERLLFLRNNQQGLRVAGYIDLCDAI